MDDIMRKFKGKYGTEEGVEEFVESLGVKIEN